MLLKIMGFWSSEVNKNWPSSDRRARSANFRTWMWSDWIPTVNVPTIYTSFTPWWNPEDKFKLQSIVEVLYNNKWFGDKTGPRAISKLSVSGWNKRNWKDSTLIPMNTSRWENQNSKRFEASKEIDDLKKRIQVSMNFDDFGAVNL